MYNTETHTQKRSESFTLTPKYLLIFPGILAVFTMYCFCNMKKRNFHFEKAKFYTVLQSSTSVWGTPAQAHLICYCSRGSICHISASARQGAHA